MKERLTGAIILVALLVLLVPELLTGPGPANPVAGNGTTESGQMRSYTIDLAEGANTRRSATLPPVEAPMPAPAGPQDGGSEPEPIDPGTAGVLEAADEAAQAAPLAADDAAPERRASRPPTESVREPAAAVAERAPPAPAVVPPPPTRVVKADAPAGKGWMVQLGSFASRENATRLAGQLKDKGFAANVNETTGSGKRLYRVRVGPEADRAAAEALRAKLRAAGHAGTLVAYP